jgi:hypothetical protein
VRSRAPPILSDLVMLSRPCMKGGNGQRQIQPDRSGSTGDVVRCEWAQSLLRLTREHLALASVSLPSAACEHRRTRMKAGLSTAIYPVACSLSLHGDRVSQIERASFTALSTSRGRAGELPVELQHDVSAGVGILRS